VRRTKSRCLSILPLSSATPD